MPSIPDPAGVVGWPEGKLSLCSCIAIVPTAGLSLCEPLPYTASRVQVLLQKVVIPKPGSMYVPGNKIQLIIFCCGDKASQLLKAAYRSSLVQSNKTLTALQGVCENKQQYL